MMRPSSAADWSDDGHAPQRLRRFGLFNAFDDERARFFLWSPVCLGLGIAAYFALPAEPPLFAAFVPFIFASIVAFVVGRGTLISAFVAALCLAGAGFALAKLRAEMVRAPVLQKTLRNAEVTGVVTRAETRVPRGQRLTISVENLASLPQGQRPAVVRVSTMKAGPPIHPGERVQLKATLSPPAKPAIPGGFDFARTAWFEQIGGVGYSFSSPVVQSVSDDGSLRERYRIAIEDIRQSIGARIREALPGETGSIATALVTGERAGISVATNAAYKDSGLYHMLSISGLHMVIRAGTVFYLVRFAFAAVPALALRLPIKKIAAAGGMLAALGYLAISGGAFATVRAALMILIIFGAVLLDRPALALRNVALAAFVILALYPESLLDAGFQMSFAAVTALIAAYEEIRRRFKHRSGPHPVLRVLTFFGGIILTTVIASAAVAPFAAYHFHQSQQYAALANLIAIPICNFVVMPAALMALLLMPFGLEGVALWPMGFGIDAMTWCATQVAALPGAAGRIPAMPWLAFALFLAGGLWITLWQTRFRMLGALAVIAGILVAPTLQRPDILVAANGELVAVRTADGKLSALPLNKGKFELSRWLEHDGDWRAPREVQKAAGFTCDAAGCATRIKGTLIAVARHASALADDCSRAEIAIMAMPRPRPCDGPGVVIDFFDVWRAGTHAVYLEGEAGKAATRVRVDTVALRRGDRPWSPLIRPRVELRQPALPKPKISARTSDAKPAASDGAADKTAAASWRDGTPDAPQSFDAHTADDEASEDVDVDAALADEAQ
jgi:competence protein ComEC